MEGTLNEWTAAAVPLIQRTIAAFTDDGTDRGTRSSSSRNNNNTGRSRQSLASALTSRDCSPQNGRRSHSNGDGGANEAQHHQPGHARSQSGLWRVVNKDRGGEVRGASGEVEGGCQLAQGGGGEGGGGGATCVGEGKKEVVALMNGDEKMVSSSSSSSSNVKEEQRARLGSEGNELEAAQADFAELLRDAQEETGGGTRTGPQEGVMEALLETSEGLVAAVETQQKVSEAS